MRAREHMHPKRPEEGSRCPGTGVRDGDKPPCVLGMKPGFSARAISALITEPSLQPH